LTVLSVDSIATEWRMWRQHVALPPYRGRHGFAACLLPCTGGQ